MAMPTPRQPSFFESSAHGSGVDPTAPAAAGTIGPTTLPLRRDQLLAWQQRVQAHQAPLFASLPAEAPGQPVNGAGSPASDQQGSLFASPSPGTPTALAGQCNPLGLTPLALDFWRWPQPPHRGASLYFVFDRPDPLPWPLLLYVGETGRADRRWKGEHDCKGYLAAYAEALGRADLSPMLSIRFWCDVPTQPRARRQLEQLLIRRWASPFNKENRDRWATPFTADPD
jgi:hypothetical protein